jgi:hypothetical protein
MSTTELNNATTATATADKKVAVKKVIPKATMNYLKFALVILKSGSTDIIKELLLEKSIDTIIDFVNEIVKNGNQDKEIVEMRKVALAPPKKSRAKPKAKNDDNSTPADTIVSDLVSLARNESANESESEPVPKKSRAKPKAKAAVVPANGDAEAPAEGDATTAEAKPKKSRAKPKADAKVADAKVADAKVADANAAEVTPELKSDDFKSDDNKPAGDKPAGDKPAGDKPADDKPADDKPKKSRAKPKPKPTADVAVAEVADAEVADDC